MILLGLFPISIYISSNELLIEENKSSLCEDILKSIENKLKSEIIENKPNMSFNQDLVIPSLKFNETGSNWFDKSIQTGVILFIYLIFNIYFLN